MNQAAKNQRAINAFIAKKADIDLMLDRLKKLSDDHFNADPDDVNWGHVGDLGRYAQILKGATDIAFGEGEIA